MPALAVPTEHHDATLRREANTAGVEPRWSRGWGRVEAVRQWCGGGAERA